MIDARSICRGVVEGVIPFPLLVYRYVRVDDCDRLLFNVFCCGRGLRDGDGGEAAVGRPAADGALVRAFALKLPLKLRNPCCAYLCVEVVNFSDII